MKFFIPLCTFILGYALAFIDKQYFFDDRDIPNEDLFPDENNHDKQN